MKNQPGKNVFVFPTRFSEMMNADEYDFIKLNNLLSGMLPEKTLLSTYRKLLLPYKGPAGVWEMLQVDCERLNVLGSEEVTTRFR